MSGLTRLGIVFVLTFLLAACGSGDAETPWDIADDTASGSTDGSTDGSTSDGGDTLETVIIGSGSGTSFVPGVIAIAVTSLSAGGTTGVSTSLVNENGDLRQEVDSISFSSPCIAANDASIDSPVSTSGGIATTTYVAQGCSGTDTITATTTVNGITISAEGTLTVQPAIIGSMEFVSADPTNIGISGFGLIEVSEVTFRVLDENGNPVSGQLVSFSLNTEVGGVNLTNTSDTSDVNGIVRADVNSGTIPTTVKVTATLTTNGGITISTQSDGLIISTGIADQNSMTISAETLNPEAWDYNGIVVPITVHAADHYNNPVPDGTAVSFTTEGGQIESQCQTTNGGCSVDWTSSNPRPDDGRVTILATMLGEETFVDTNGNGALDAADTFVPNGIDDKPEAFRDDDGDGFRDDNEEFLDFNRDVTYTFADEKYNGALCCSPAKMSTDPNSACYDQLVQETAFCSDETNIHVRGSLELIMSSHTAVISFEPAPIVVPVDGIGSTTLTVTDIHEQTMALGTKIDIEAKNGTLETPGSFTVNNTNTPATYDISVSGDGTSSIGLLTVTVTSPDESETIASIQVTD